MFLHVSFLSHGQHIIVILKYWINNQIIILKLNFCDYQKVIKKLKTQLQKIHINHIISTCPFKANESHPLGLLKGFSYRLNKWEYMHNYTLIYTAWPKTKKEKKSHTPMFCCTIFSFDNCTHLNQSSQKYTLETVSNDCSMSFKRQN